MVALGPRVGGAHVGVDLKMDAGSIDEVGKRIHQQLVNMGDRNRKAYQRLGASAVTAWRSALGAIVSSAPLIGSAVSALAGGVTMIAGAFASAIKSAYGLVTVLGSVAVAAGTAVIGFQGFGAALSASNPEELSKALKNLAPNARSSAIAVRSLKDEAHSLRLTVQDTMFEGLSKPIRELSNTLLPVAEKGLNKMAGALNGLAREVLNYVNSSAGLKQISAVLDGSASIFERLSGAAVPGLDGILRLFNALVPAGERLADRITSVAESFQSWTQGEGFAKRIDAGMKQAEKTAGLLFNVLGNLGGAIANVFNAANPATNTFLEMLGSVTQKFQDWTGSVEGQDAIAKWATQSVDVMRQFGETAGAAFELIAELADPRIITSFLKTLQTAFEYLSSLPLDSIVSGFATMAEMLEPISAAFLAVVIAGASFNILLGNLIGQVGGFVSAMVGGKGVVGKFFGAFKGGGASVGLLTRIKNAFSVIEDTNLKSVGKFFSALKGSSGSASGLSKIASAFSRIGGFLATGLRFAGLAGMAVWIGTLIAKSQSLQDKIKNAFNELKGVFSALGGAFSEIGAALSPVISSLEPVFTILDKIATLAIGVVIDMIAESFRGLSSVITGVGSIIAGFITTIRGIFTLFSGGGAGGILDGLKQMFSGIGPLLKGVWLLFINFFAPAKFLRLGMLGLRGLWSGIKSVFPLIMTGMRALGPLIMQGLKALPGKLLSVGTRMLTFLWDAIKAGTPKVLSGIGSMVSGVVQFIGRLPGRMRALGMRALTFLWNAVKAGTPKILSAAGRILTGVVKWIGRLPGKLRSLGMKALSFLWKAVKAGTPKILSAAGRIFKGVAKWIGRLPGKLLSLGRSAITRLAGAVRSGISKLTSIARSIFRGIINSIKALPGRLSSMGRSAISRLASAVRSGISRLSSIARSILNGILNALRALPGRLSSMGRSAISRLASAVRSGVGRLRSIASQIVSSITGALKSLPGKLLSAGREAIGKLASGILGGLGKVKDAAGKVAGALGKFFPGSPIKEGPLRSWNNGGAGRRLTGMLSKGVLDGASDVDRAGAQVARAMNSTLSPFAGPTASGARAAGIAGAVGGGTNVTVYMTVSIDDLSKMTKVGDFIDMLDDSRVNSRKTLRSGKVAF